MSETSWENFSKWYDQLVGEKGHYYHEHVILPRLMPLLALQPDDSVLDLGCGQGILERAIPKSLRYHGIDIAASLIQAATQKARDQRHTFTVADFTQPLSVAPASFSHAIFLLSLQNVKAQQAAIQQAATALKAGGKLTVVLNHPCFRIPRQSSWGVDESKKLQYRRLDRYLSPLEIPIHMTPSSGKTQTSFSYHYPLSSYGAFFKAANFLLVAIEEWISDKKSEGGSARMEDRARTEFPLFLTLQAVKQ